jgi:hypothetical protein
MSNRKELLLKQAVAAELRKVKKSHDTNYRTSTEWNSVGRCAF